MAGDDRGDDVSTHLGTIHAHLSACLERPVERTASRWIGEAEAVTRDLVENDASDAVIATRLGHVRDLLSEVDETGDEAASEHVARASEETERLLDGLE